MGSRLRRAITLGGAVLALLIASPPAEGRIVGGGTAGAGGPERCRELRAASPADCGRASSGGRGDRSRADRGHGIGDTTGKIDAGEATGGTANPLSLRNPLCGRLKGRGRVNCRYGQGPESPYPVSNYGLDIYADDSGSGSDAIVGNFQKLLAAIANAIWMVMIYALKAILTFVGWAFSLVPFANDRASARVDAGLENFYANFTSPWLVFAFVCLGAWALWRGVVKRELTQTAGGLVLSVVLMVLALWVLHEPRESVGRAASIVDEATLGVIAAPQDRSLADPEGSYAKATERAWHVMTAAPYAALQFSDSDWALQAPDPGLKAYAWEDTERYCSDAAFFGSEAVCNAYRAALGEPRSNAELLLASSPGSQVRSDEMWNEFDGHVVQEKMAMQGGGGAWLRLPLVLLFAIGLTGALALFAWIAVRLFVQTAIAFVLVLSTPLALFFPAFGEKGRAAFTFWGGTLLGAIVAKLVYAALLAIVLFGTSVIFGMVGSASRGITVTMGFLLAAGFWWAIFLKRQEIAGFFSLSDRGEGGSGAGVGTALGAYAAYRLGGQLVGAAGRRMGARRREGDERAPFAGSAGAGGSDEPRTKDEEQASAQLAGRAAERLAHERQLAHQTTARSLAREQEIAELRARAREQTERAGSTRERAERDPEHRQRYDAAAEAADRQAERLNGEAARLERDGRQMAPAEERARAFLERASENEQRIGRPFTERELAQSREAIRHNLNRPVESGVHGHYVGKSRREYEALEGREREEAHRRVAARIKEDKAAFGVIPDRPGGAPARRAETRTYRQARAESVGDDAFREERRAAQRLQKARLARDRRDRRHHQRRRRSGLSR